MQGTVPSKARSTSQQIIPAFGKKVSGKLTTKIRGRSDSCHSITESPSSVLARPRRWATRISSHDCRQLSFFLSHVGQACKQQSAFIHFSSLPETVQHERIDLSPGSGGLVSFVLRHGAKDPPLRMHATLKRTIVPCPPAPVFGR